GRSGVDSQVARGDRHSPHPGRDRPGRQPGRAHRADGRTRSVGGHQPDRLHPRGISAAVRAGAARSAARVIAVRTSTPPMLAASASTCASKSKARPANKPITAPHAGYKPLRNFLHRECKFLREYFEDIYFSRRQEARNILTHCKTRSEEHTSELQSRENLVCRLLLEKKKK